MNAKQHKYFVIGQNKTEFGIIGTQQQLNKPEHPVSFISGGGGGGGVVFPLEKNSQPWGDSRSFSRTGPSYQ